MRSYDLPPHSPTAALKRLRELLSDPKRWTKRASARRRNGNPVFSGDRAAHSFCLLGGFDRVAHSRPSAAFDALTAPLGQHCRAALVGFNDKASTTHADVLAFIDKAIELRLRRVAGRGAR